MWSVVQPAERGKCQQDGVILLLTPYISIYINPILNLLYTVCNRIWRQINTSTDLSDQILTLDKKKKDKFLFFVTPVTRAFFFVLRTSNRREWNGCSRKIISGEKSEVTVWNQTRDFSFHSKWKTLYNCYRDLKKNIHPNIKRKKENTFLESYVCHLVNILHSLFCNRIQIPLTLQLLLFFQE